MKRLLIVMLFTNACGSPIYNKLADCNMTFAAETVKSVEYQSCNKQAMIQDFTDYIAYISQLIQSGEHYDQIIIGSVPRRIYETRAIYCSRGCSATHFLHGQCVLYEAKIRKGYQIIDKLARQEHNAKPHCKKAYAAKDLQNGFPYRNYDWKKGFKRWDLL